MVCGRKWGEGEGQRAHEACQDPLRGHVQVKRRRHDLAQCRHVLLACTRCGEGHNSRQARQRSVTHVRVVILQGARPCSVKARSVTPFLPGSTL